MIFLVKFGSIQTTLVNSLSADAFLGSSAPLRRFTEASRALSLKQPAELNVNLLLAIIGVGTEYSRRSPATGEPTLEIRPSGLGER